MRTYEETAQRVLARRDEYNKKRSAQRRWITTAAACLCLCALLGTGAWRMAQVKTPAPTDSLQEDAAQPTQDSGARELDGQHYEHPYPAVTEYTESVEEQDREMSVKRRRDREICIDSAEGPAPVGEPNWNDREREPNWHDSPVTELPGDTGALKSTGSIWGGSYMENGHWYVLLTENTAEYQYEVFCMNPVLTEDNVTFLPADYSLDHLTELMQRISDRMADGSLAVASSAALREDVNRVELDVSIDIETAERQLAALGIETDALLIVPEQGAVMTEDLCALPRNDE